MKRVNKSKRGFTLVEMILVVAIIVILAGAFALGVRAIINKTKQAQANVNASKNLMQSNINASEKKLSDSGF